MSLTNTHSKCVSRGILFALALLSVGGCRSETTEDAQSGRTVERRASKGPVSLTVRAEDDELRVAEKLKLTVDVQAEKEVRVTLPEIGTTIGGFRVVRCTDAPDVPKDDGRLWRRTLELQSRTSGKRTIPPQAVVFEDRRDPAKPVHGEVKTEPIEINVVSVLEGRADPRKFRDIKGAVELQPEPSYTWVYVAAGGAGAAVMLAGAAVILVRRKRNRALTAESWALRQLDKLAKSKLTQPGRARQFYYRLSDIVREYLERRFALRASRETTEEFLADVQIRPFLSEDHKGFLRSFLAAADLAKYACYQPGEEEILSALDTARTFVISSALRAEENAKAKKPSRRRRRAKKETVAA
ncbi:MAG: hypothetical protein JXA11_12535 [Phycisphaerae bacterium]|nr:hypothetical protein [Phycisphaerae bacterium]